MKKPEVIAIYLRDKSRKIINGIIIVKDEIALIKFPKEPNYAKLAYEKALKMGKNCAYDKKLDAYIQKYENKKQNEIVDILKKETLKAGGFFKIEKW